MFDQISCISFAVLVLRNALFVSGNCIYLSQKLKILAPKSTYPLTIMLYLGFKAPLK